MRTQNRCLAVLSRQVRNRSTRRIIEEGRRAGAQVRVVDPWRIRVLTGPEPGIRLGRERLSPPDAVLTRLGVLLPECGLAAARWWETAGARVVNRPGALLAAKDKMLQLVELQAAGLPVPPSVLTRDARGVGHALRDAGGPPLVVKTLRGAQGLGVMLAESPGAAASILQTLWGLERLALLQAFRPSPAVSDVRVIVVAGVCIAAMRRYAARGEFRSNVHRGGKSEPLRPPAALARLACRAARVLRLDVAGVDVLETPDGYEILEVNTSPGIGEIERVTGVNVAGAMVQCVISPVA